MKTIKGPGIFLTQFIGNQAPFNSLDGLAGWAAGKGYKAVQIPVTIRRFSIWKRQPKVRPIVTRSRGSWLDTGWRSANCPRIWKGN